MRVRFSKKFAKQYEKAPQKIKDTFENRLKLFQRNQFNPTLNNHTLGGRFKGYRSINVTGDWRAVYSRKNEDTIYFELLGTHSQLYR